jgi:hypothetical protein
MLGASHWWGFCACRQCRNGRGNKAEQTVYKRTQRRKERRAWAIGGGSLVDLSGRATARALRQLSRD